MRKPALPFAEFIALIAVMFAMIAFGSDAMLPAFPEIARDLELSDVNQAQLVISVFLLGTGLGQLFTGPMSDSFGRKPVILGGLAVYAAGCVVSIWAGSLEILLLSRFVQGLGVSAPRTATMAMVRDLYAGRMMARVMSTAMVFFVLVPAVAPFLGQSLMQSFGWRSIFVAFIVFAGFGAIWLAVRQPETHPPEKRLPVNVANYAAALREILRSRIVITYTLVLSLGFASLFAYLSSAQQVYVDVFDKGTSFPLYFAGIALVSGASGIVNATLVVRLGMRRLATFAFGSLCVITILFLLITLYAGLSPDGYFNVFLIWSVLTFFVPGLTFGNLNALALEPMGHIAGMVSAIMGALSTLMGVAMAIPIGLAFNGSILPLLVGFVLCSGAAFFLMLTNPKED